MKIKTIKKLKIRFFWLTLERFPNIFRPSSKPYTSGDTLRKMSDHIFDESKNINIKKIKTNDIIFLNSDLIEIFFKFYDKKINSRYILITHNSDRNVGEEEISYISKNVIHWFAQNLVIEEQENVSFIPIGLENLRRLKHGRKKWFKNVHGNKSKFILSSFDIYTNYQKRSLTKEELSEIDIVDTKYFDSTKEYYENLNNYMFAICPEGNGVDTHRIWESLILKVMPVVVLNSFTKNLKNNSVPCLYLNDWKDLHNFSSHELKKIYNDFSSHLDNKFVMYNFWENKITSKSIT